MFKHIMTFTLIQDLRSLSLILKDIQLLLTKSIIYHKTALIQQILPQVDHCGKVLAHIQFMFNTVQHMGQSRTLILNLQIIQKRHHGLNISYHFITNTKSRAENFLRL
jgi:hypothetical protein